MDPILFCFKNILDYQKIIPHFIKIKFHHTPSFDHMCTTWFNFWLQKSITKPNFGSKPPLIPSLNSINRVFISFNSQAFDSQIHLAKNSLNSLYLPNSLKAPFSKKIVSFALKLTNLWAKPSSKHFFLHQFSTSKLGNLILGAELKQILEVVLDRKSVV